MNKTNVITGALALVTTLAGCAHELPRPVTAARTHGEGFELPILRLSAAGRHVCAIGYADPVQCMHVDGERTETFDVPGTEGAVDVAITEDRGCALFGSGRVSCFSFRGAAPTAARLIEGMDDAFEIALGGELVCARSEGGNVRCATDGSAFEVRELSGAVEIALDEGHACARTASGTVSCWTAAEPVALAVAGVGAATTLAGGEGGLFATNTRGELVRIAQWGRPEWMFGTVVAQLADAADLAAAEGGACATTGRGETVCWSATSRTARAADRLHGTHDVSMGSRFACGISGEGDLRCASLGPDAARAVPRSPRLSSR